MPLLPGFGSRVTSTRGLAVTAMLGVTIATGCGSPSDRTTVHVGDDAWTVLLAGRDGMRGRSGFDGADGMLFDFDRDVRPAAVAFVMDGVAFPLDIAWFTEAGELVGTASMAVCPAEPCPLHAPDEPFRWAIEAPPGAFADVRPGDRLTVAP